MRASSADGIEHTVQPREQHRLVTDAASVPSHGTRSPSIPCAKSDPDDDLAGAPMISSCLTSALC